MDFKEVLGGRKSSHLTLGVEETQDILEVIKIREGGRVVEFSSHTKV